MAGKIFFRITVLLVMLIGFSGCTLVGFVGGSIYDSRRAVVKAPAWGNMKRLEPGTAVKIESRDGQVVSGTFRQLAEIDSAEYARRYETFRAGADLEKLFPALSDTIILDRKYGLINLQEGYFLFGGFELNSIRLCKLPGRQFTTRTMDSLITISNQQGRKMDARTIKMYLDEGVVPLRSELVLQAGDKSRRIGSQDIRKIKLPATYRGRITFTLAGLAVDLLGLYIMGQEMSKVHYDFQLFN
jgi:hypothetical protein